MFSHIMVGSEDIEASRKFYNAVFAALGLGEGRDDPKGRVWWMTSRGAFAVGAPIDGEAACHANGGTIGFHAKDESVVDAFHAAGVANGGTSIEDPPGRRPNPFGDMYLAYLRDPSGNKICAVYRYG